jgi:hypothetical protein
MSLGRRTLATLAVAGIVWATAAMAGCENSDSGRSRPTSPGRATTAPATPDAPTAPDAPAVPDAQDESPLTITQRLPDPTIEPPAPAVALAPEGFDFSPRETDAARYPLRFETNRKAVFQCGGRQANLPGTLWLDEQRAPGGDVRIAFQPCIDGSFRFFYGDQEPCSFTDEAGSPLKVLRCSLELSGDDETKPMLTIYKLHLAP